ncbi:MAG: RidA family protein [Desulfovibrionaceae bacterium]
MKKIDTFHTDKAPAAVGPYSQAIGFGEMLFVSGQLGFDPATGLFAGGEDDFAAQARQALNNLSAILTASDSSLEKVLAVDVFLTNMKRFAEFNSIYEEFFHSHKPARAAIEVSGLPKGGLVEIKCVAVRMQG